MGTYSIISIQKICFQKIEIIDWSQEKSFLNDFELHNDFLFIYTEWSLRQKKNIKSTNSY